MQALGLVAQPALWRRVHAGRVARPFCGPRACRDDERAGIGPRCSLAYARAEFDPVSPGFVNASGPPQHGFVGFLCH
eukprot:998162-Lingulodinium_polyedra.AAC.1